MIYKEAKKIISLLKNQKVGVIPTDTLYGLVCIASSKTGVNKIYRLKKRDRQKPLIVLISKINDLKKFGVEIDSSTKKILKKIWPGKVSVTLQIIDKEKIKSLKYLHRSKCTLAFRMPADEEILNIIKKTGPLVAPSANLEGLKTAKNIKEAYKYFGDKIDFYLDGGNIISKPSTIIHINKGVVKILRKGAVLGLQNNDIKNGV